MKYFTELIKSYLRLNEQTPAPGNAESQAKALIQSANSLAPGASVPIKGDIVLKKGEDGNIYIEGYGGFPITVTDSSGAENPEGFAKLVGLLSGEGEPEGSGKEAAPTATGPQGTAPIESKYPYLPSNRVASPNKVKRMIEDICQEEIESKRTLKERKAAIQECDNISSNIGRLVNDTKGSIAETLDRTTKIIVNCDEDNMADCEVNSEDEQESIEHRIAAFETIQKSIDILMKTQQSDDKILSTEDCAFLKRSISITGGGKSKKIAVIGANKRGMLITQERTTLLHDVLTKLTKGVRCGDSKSDYFKYESDTVSFLTSAGIAGSSGSTTRGFFFEDLRAGVAIMLSCGNDPSQRSECEREASNKLLQWTNNPQKLERALRDLINKLNEDGEFAVQLNDEVGMAFVHDFLFRALNNGESAEQALRQVLNYMARTASLGLSERAPSKVEKTGTKVGKGRKSDLTEYYLTEEDANKAIDKMKLPPNQRALVKVRKEGDRFLIGDSLKYSGDCRSVAAGQAAGSNIVKATEEPREHREWFDEMAKVGISRANIEAAKNSVDEFEQHKATLLALARGTLVTKRGNQKERIPVDQRVAASRAISREITNILGADSPLALAVQSRVREFVNNGRDWEDVATSIADAIFKTRLRTDILSSDPRVASNAAKMIATFSCFAGLSSDGTLLSVADAVKGEMYISSQNYHVRKLVEKLDEISKITDVEERKKLLKFNEKSIKIGDDFTLCMYGMDSELSINGDFIKDNSAPKRRIKRGVEN